MKWAIKFRVSFLVGVGLLLLGGAWLYLHGWPKDATVDVAVCLPREKIDGLPSDEFVHVLNEAAQAVALGRTGSVVSLITTDWTAFTCGKIILSSYDVSEDRVMLASTPKASVRVGNCDGNRTSSTLPPEALAPNAWKFSSAVIVLGNQPLDDTTPTAEMVQRILTAVDFAQKTNDTVLVVTGGPTAGQVSEAKMMALIALSRGVPRHCIVMEERAMSTDDNAKLTAPIALELRVKSVYVCSNASHLKWAMPSFQKLAIFRDARPLESPDRRGKTQHQIEERLKRNDSDLERERLKSLKTGRSGID